MRQENPLCQFRLAWNTSEQQQRQQILEVLQLPVVASTQLTQFPVNEEVTQLVALLMSARAKEEIVSHLDRRDYRAAKSSLQSARQQVMSAPSSAAMVEEYQALNNLESQLSSGDYVRMRKQAHYESWGRSHSNSNPYSSRRNQRRQRKMDLTGLKWIKNVTDPRPEVQWAYHPDAINQYPDVFHANWDLKMFGLNWPDHEQKNAQVPKFGELILLKQNNCITHLVQLMDNDVVIDSHHSDYTPYRMVKIIWMTSDWNNPPKVESIFDCQMNLQGGKLANIDNFEAFKAYWHQGKGGLIGFQEHLRQVLKLS